MPKYAMTVLLMRLLLPAALLCSMALRPFGISVLYLLLYLWLPLLPVPDSRTYGGWRSRILIVHIVVSVLLLLLHVAWHVVLAAFPPYGSILQQFDVEHIMYNLGFVSYENIDVLTAFHFVAPELVMTVASIVVFVATKTLLKGPPNQDEIQLSKYQQNPFLTTAGKYMSLFLIMFSGILQPSVTSALYYLVFIGSATAWAVGNGLSRGYAVVCRCVMAIMAAHVALLMAYQSSYVTQLLPPDNMFARIFGLVEIVKISFEDELTFSYADATWPRFISPVMILFTYFVLGLETRELFKPKLIRGMNPSRKSIPRRVTPNIRGLHQDSTGSVVVPDDEDFSNQMPPGLIDEIVLAIISFFQVLIRSSYIATSITMMVWSILYHSWLTFVLLMWANIVWLQQNQRSFMLRSSPVLVCYAIFLLLSQYIYGMDLTEQELPSKISDDVNLGQIGFSRPQSEACVPLLIKSLLACMFWVTLKQSKQEVSQRKQSAAIADMVAPLQLTVSTAASAMGRRESVYQESRLLKKFGDLLMNFCTRYWIYVVTIMLFVIGITGERMTIFRIIYMFLFLSFILLFQISWTLWRKLMYAFWIVIIIYSMLNLVLVYIYQFDYFPETIEKYLAIPVKLQHDLGLEKYNKADLFVRLLTPTCFLIITIMQVHYFHKGFLELSRLSLSSSTGGPSSNRPSQSGMSTGRNDTKKDSIEPNENKQSDDAEEIDKSKGDHTEDEKLKKGDKTNGKDITTKEEKTKEGKKTKEGDETKEDDVNVEIKPESKKDKATNVHVIMPFPELRDRNATQDLTDAENSVEMSSQPRTSFQTSLPRKKSSAPTVTEHTSSIGLRDWLESAWRKVSVVYHKVRELLFLYLELHMIKFVLLALMLLSVLNVCALHVPIMLIICPALMLNAKQQTRCVVFLSILINAYLLIKMIYQIPYIPHSLFEVNCTWSDNKTGSTVSVYNNAEWVGFYKTGDENKLPRLLKGYITVIALLIVHTMVIYRQQRYRSYGLTTVNKGKTMFPDVTRKEADQNLISCIKYLINYGFYKFGVEITLICLMGVIGSRMDLYAVFYAVWLLILVSANRKRQACLWPTFTVFVMLLPMLQYMIAVGFLPQFCIEYPWRGDDSSMQALRHWLFLPYPEDAPHATKIIFDYVLLLLCSRQKRVFLLEKWYGDNYEGGSNSEQIGNDWETQGFVNPVPDFMSVISSYLDVVKRIVFLGMLWFTLAIMFLAGTNRVNLFSMGYLFGSFIFLWQGTDFYLRPKNSILKWWSWLLKYNVCVVLLKTFLQIPGCMFNTFLQENACWLVQLLGIGCVDKFTSAGFKGFLRMATYKNTEAVCAVPQEDIGLAWDGVCFAFLLLQKRFFHSYYFYRVIDESKATTILASRGAELIEELRQKQMQQQENQEMKILEKIKVKMERIKANQKKIQGSHYVDAPQHDAERYLGRPKFKRREPTSHQKAVRSGDYYMFDDYDDVDIESLVEDTESSDEDIPKEMGLGKRQREGSVEPGRSDAPKVEDTVDRSDTVLMAPSVMDIGPPQEETVVDKLKHYMAVAGAFLESIIVSLTRYLLRYSRDYRYVSKALFNEKKILKEKEGFGIGIREGSHMVWQPFPEDLLSRNEATTMDEREDSMFTKSASTTVHLLYALWYVILSHTDIVCYLMVFINQIQSATILSIPLPLMVFVWGTLSIPRPTKTFWVTLIAYTEVIVLVKSMFQFEVLPWNQKSIPENMPFSAPRVIGIERKSNYALYDLLLLLIIFFHRFMLKSLGLWKESSAEIELREDAMYKPTDEDMILLGEGRVEEVGMAYAEKHSKTGGTRRQHRIAQEHPDQGETEEEGKSKESLDHHKLKTVEQLQQHAPSGEQDNNDYRDNEHFDADNDETPIIEVTTVLEDPKRHCPMVVKLAVKRYCRPMHLFFVRMLDPTARVTADVYAYMFMCDFFNFLVVIFGFAAFGTHQGDGGVQAYLEDNKVPVPFLVMLILQFALIIIDRALYLRKFILGKILFQYALIIGVHIWMFFVLPFITERTFNTLLPPPMWYMVKCIYLLLSAYQIRCGYPRRIIGNFLCKGYNYINMFLFRGFMAVPFVFELRTLMDWVWTDTSMTLMDWLKMEDIFANVFLLKCARYVEDEFPQPRGTKKTPMSKYLMGGTALAFIIAIIWFPLVLFAFGNTVGKSNPPSDVTVKIRIGPFLPAYMMTAQSHNIDLFTEADYDQLSNLYAKDRTAQTFLSNYMYDDVAAVTLNADSTNVWAISPPELTRLEKESQSNESLSIKMTYVITHVTNSKDNPPTIEEEREVDLVPYYNTTRNPQREILFKMLNGTANENEWLLVPVIFPKFVKVFNKGTAKPAYQLITSPTLNLEEMQYRNILMQLKTSGSTHYWRVKEDCSRDTEYNKKLKSIPRNDCNQLVMYTFNDKLFPETLNFISGSGIIGLYTTFVFLASRLLRGFFSGIYSKIMFEDLPNVDRVLQMCLDIYLVREALELALEEDLFAKLVFLYRSPETMIKWSRPKEERDEPLQIEDTPRQHSPR